MKALKRIWYLLALVLCYVVYWSTFIPGALLSYIFTGNKDWYAEWADDFTVKYVDPYDV
jgi:hypothetical protein